MPLRMLPDIVFPIKGTSINPLMDSLVQLNLIEGGINERQQFALGINFHIFDLWIKSSKQIDYRGLEGHNRMLQHAFNYAGANPAITRHGDLAAAHLAVDYHDTQKRLQEAGEALLPSDVSALLEMSKDLAVFAPLDEKRVLLLLDVLSKKPA